MGAEHLKSWKPGQSGNPSGKPKLPEHLRAIKALTQEEVTRIVSKYGRMTMDELDTVLLARQAPAIEMCIAKLFVKSHEYGDTNRISFLLDRAVGKVPVAAETAADIAARKDLERLTDRELIQLVKEKLPALEQLDGKPDPAAS